jgi:tripartite-type tricarboxylate transporter receptor subunit TctC
VKSLGITIECRKAAKWCCLFGIFVCATFATAASGQDYPNRPIHFVVPTGPGGITDLLARIVADKLGQAMKQPVIVENRGGAGGIIGSEYVAKAKPDGYTLLFAYPTHVVNPSLYAKLPYDTLTDFVPVTMVSMLPVVLAVPNSSPARDLQELIALAKKQPGSLNYSSVGNGSLGFLAAELFALDAGIKIVQVAYRGTPQATMALLSGEVSLFFDAPLTLLPLVKTGEVRALGVTSKGRLAVLPDVPAINESVPGYEALGWNGIFAPKGTPRSIIERLNRETVAILKRSDVNEQLVAQGLEIMGDSPEEFEAAVTTDIEKWKKVLRGAGVRAE